MKLNPITVLASAAALCFLPIASYAQYGTPSSASSQASSAPHRGSREAMKMVRARVDLLQTLDANKTKPGDTFRAKLDDTIHLDNGTELPSGSVLVGTVEQDDMYIAGNSKLALRFTQATLKDGRAIPIKATIVNVAKPESSLNDAFSPTAPGDQMPNSWSDGTLKVDQLDAISGVDLHSSVASRNSGVFVTTKEHDVTLRSGTEFALAIAGRNRE